MLRLQESIGLAQRGKHHVHGNGGVRTYGILEKMTGQKMEQMIYQYLYCSKKGLIKYAHQHFED